MPLAERDASRLIVVDRGADRLLDARFRDLPSLLDPGDLLMLNDTAVFPARLFARRPSGGRVEILLVREAEHGEWEALVRPARRVAPGDRLALLDRSGMVAKDAAATIVGTGPSGGRRIRLDLPGEPWSWIARNGHVPLPPYIDRPDEAADRERYQTVYAKRRGAVAAPTAGLHFTDGLLDALATRGIETACVTLHVGPGTFRPVEGEVEDHRMEAEWIAIPAAAREAMARTRQAGRRVVAVGTTTVRALESFPDPAPDATTGWSDLFIRPGHRFQAIDALVTNLHLPRSTLLLLVAAFAGEELTSRAYRHAIDAGYRFYSYGDAMLVL